VTRRLLVIPLLAALLFLPGCFWWMAPMAAFESGSGSSSYGPDEAGMSAVRAAIPAIEAYYADNGTYKGATLKLLQQRYDAGITGIRVVQANAQTYCIESTEGGSPWHKAGPSADVLPGDCGIAVLPPTPPLSLPEQAQALYGADRVMREFQAQHGTYEGITARDLEWAIPELKSIRIVEATRASFCLETKVDGETWIVRQSGDVGIGSC
jgi:hypothetical protein